MIHDPAFWGYKRKQAGEREALRLHHQQLAGERDAALAQVAVLTERVAGLEAQVAQLAYDKAFYMELWIECKESE